MALTITINGVSKGLLGLTISSQQGQQDRLSAQLVSQDGTDRPTIDDVVIVTEDGLRTYGGSIKMPTLSGFGSGTDLAKAPVVSTSFTALDFNELAQRRQFTGTIPAGTLKSQADLMRAYLSTPALTVTLGMTVDGPAMPEWTYIDTYVVDILNAMAAAAGYLWEINYSLELWFFQVGDRVAPWNVADGDGNTYGDLKIAKTRVNYANRIKVKFGAGGVAAHATLLSDNASDFVNNATFTVGGKIYTLQMSLTNTDGNIAIAGTISATLARIVKAINLTGIAGTDYAAAMTINSQVTASQSSLSVYGGVLCTARATGTAGNSIVVSKASMTTHKFWSDDFGALITGVTQYMFGGAEATSAESVTVDNVPEQANGIYDATVEATNVTNAVDATTLGTALLADAIIAQETVEYDTTRSGLLVGVTQAIQCANRGGFNKSCIIVGLQQRWWEGAWLMRHVQAVSGTVYKGSPMHQQYQVWQGGGGATSVAGGSGSGGGGRVYALGGSHSAMTILPVAAWGPCANWIPMYASESFNARVQAWAWALHAAITASLRVTSSADGITWSGTLVCTVGSVTNQTAQPLSATFLAAAGTYYRLEILSSSNAEGVGCVGYVEQI